LETVRSDVETVSVAVATVVRLVQPVCSTTACTLVPIDGVAANPFTTIWTVPSFEPPTITEAEPVLAFKLAKPSRWREPGPREVVVDSMLPVICPYHS
jgi:hypothetical protein